ncbi:putative glycolipid-binding domain-containing protein [Diaphorobacter aerolatus]|uniref:Putative glycolipid-binding domain-containing protein n=1 Tax=Diaphorobacter aerolatus TaxID=1288495 RepID=A0A7H0GQ47_9BURK|nr:putative glycolipid-binding domain-containing protein [Diaphorobacter aerolatus]
MHTVLWTCLDKNGQDACRVTQVSDGWSIEGTAVFCHQTAAVASLSYRVACDPDWVSARAFVQGWVGTNNIDMSIVREPGHRWFINGRHDDSLDGLRDIDLGFTPATNTNALRRLNLNVSRSSTSEAVWLDFEDLRVKRLHQEYTRVDPHTYLYASPLHGYQALLRVTDSGIVSEYPGLWRMREYFESRQGRLPTQPT